MLIREKHIDYIDSPFKQIISDFLSFKRASGLKYGYRYELLLHWINNKLQEYSVEEPILSKEIVEKLCEKKGNESLASQKDRISILRNFSQYMNARGYTAFVPPKGFGPSCKSVFRPYIFTKHEIKSIIHYADNLKPIKRYPEYQFVYPVLLRMIYSCGLRISEALHLKVEDVDITTGVIHVLHGKGNIARDCPMHKSLTEACKKYVELRKLTNLSRFFFEAPDGSIYYDKSIRGTIRNLYKKAGVSILENGRLPRIHDLRHTFSVHSLEQAEEKGLDIQTVMPVLSAYLGHTNILDTEKYITLSETSYARFVRQESAQLESLIPEVCHEN